MQRKTEEQKNNKADTKITVEKNTKTKKKTNAAEKVKKSTTKASSKSSTTTKKAAKTTTKSKKSTAKTVSKKTSTKKVTKKSTSKKSNIVEYYDLPYRYNQTVVKLLAQTPNTLFIYWDISDADRENYKKTYGENFFETTKPVLIVHNDTMNYSFEVEINDFANSWYLHVNDSKCDYRIELGRRVISSTNSTVAVQNKLNLNEYIYISSSNEIEAPNDRVLFNKTQKMVYFRNIKTSQETKKDISTFTFMRNMGKIYNIYDLYKEIYKNENIDEISNPSSNYKGDR